MVEPSKNNRRIADVGSGARFDATVIPLTRKRIIVVQDGCGSVAEGSEGVAVFDLD
jgi:hypothetical protein